MFVQGVANLPPVSTTNFSAWQEAEMLQLAIVGAAAGQAFLSMSSAIANEFIAQRVERDARCQLAQRPISWMPIWKF